MLAIYFNHELAYFIVILLIFLFDVVQVNKLHAYPLLLAAYLDILCISQSILPFSSVLFATLTTSSKHFSMKLCK